MMAVLVLGRVIAWLVQLLLCFHVVTPLRREFSFEKAAVRPLLRLGGWMAVSNMIGPLMVYLDRFLIGALISVAAVAYYATPYEVVSKLSLIPGALIGVLFPAFSSCFVQDSARTALLFRRGVKYVFLTLFPLCFIIVTVAREGLNFWLGVEFARRSTEVVQWLAVGVLINGMAQVAFALIQGVGRPDVTAKLHLIELPLYPLGVYWLINAHGIQGAAIAWVGRVALDAMLLFAVVQRFFQSEGGILSRRVLGVVLALLALFLGTVPGTTVVKGLLLFLTLFVYTLAAWFLLLAPEERIFLLSRFNITRMPH